MKRLGLTVSGVRASSVSPRSSAYTPRVCYPYYSMAQRPGPSYKWNKLDSFHVRCKRRILPVSWHDFVSNDEFFVVPACSTSRTSSVLSVHPYKRASVRPRKVFPIWRKFDVSVEVDECYMMLCCMTRSKVKVNSWRPESYENDRFQSICSAPPVHMQSKH